MWMSLLLCSLVFKRKTTVQRYSKNIIQNFIVNRKIENEEDLESHPPECLCLDHLKYYRTIKIKVLDKILNKHSDDNSK